MIKKIKKPDSLHISRLFPNMVTILGLCAGLTAVRFALTEKWELAVGFIIIASLIDMMDGRLARILNSTSEFGAQLDSLADFFNFGVAPPLILYLWITHEIKGFGWGLVLFFTICAAIRLARFNTSVTDDDNDWDDRFFVGIPAPAGALLALSPMILTFEFGAIFRDLFVYNSKDLFPVAAIIFGALIGTGMASRLPTYSPKQISIRPESASPILLIVGIMMISMIMEPWLTISFIGVIYVLSLPIGPIQFRRMQRSGK